MRDPKLGTPNYYLQDAWLERELAAAVDAGGPLELCKLRV